MINIAIVEDESTAAEILNSYLIQYEEKYHLQFQITIFTDALKFLENYCEIYDIIFMDIELPYFNGMDAAEKLRKIDKRVLLIFVTNLAKYAQKGYEVDALDFIIKPINYLDFSLKMKKALDVMSINANTEFTIKLTNGFHRIALNKLLYVEVVGHRLIFHLVSETIESNGPLMHIEKQLKGRGFLRCSHCFLVNLKHIIYVKKNILKVGNAELQISRPKRKEFIAGLVKWYSGG